MDERLHRRRGAGLSFLMGGDGEALLLLHGVPGSSQSWQKVGTHVAGRFRVVIPDLMGFGASDAPAGDYYLEAQAKSIRALLSYLQINSLYLGGHDFGAAVALTLMRLYPEVRVRGLVLAATNLFADTQIPLPLGLARLPVFNQLFGWGMAGTRWGERVLYDTAIQNKEDLPWRDFRRHLTGSGLKLARRILPRTLADLRTDYTEIEAALPQIHCPTLLLWGDEDPLYTLAVAERARALLPDALLKVYGYTGHFVPEERAIESAEDIVLRFTDIPLSVQQSRLA